MMDLQARLRRLPEATSIELNKAFDEIRKRAQLALMNFEIRRDRRRMLRGFKGAE